MSVARPFPAEKTVVVTGAGSERGIGREVVRRMAGHGWNVACLDLDGAVMEAFAAEVAASVETKVVGVACDVSSEESVDAAFGRIEAKLPPVVAVAHIAGVADPTPFMEVSLELWNKVMTVNATGTFLVNQRALRSMLDRGLGRIVNVSSASAQMGGGTYSKTPYSASKAAMLGMTRAVAREVGKFGVTLNCVSPGPIDTDIMGGKLTDERKEGMAKNLLVDRVGTTDDIAACIEFLCSESAGYITGQTYNVNGGLICS